MKKSKRIVSLLVALTMILVNFTVIADEGTTDVWDGTYDISWWDRDQDEFIITTAEQFAAIGYIGREIDRDIHGIAPDHLDGKTFILGNDIVMNDFVWDESLEFESELKPWVSARRNNFVLDGNGHTVYGLYIAPKATAGYDFNNYGIIDEIYAGGAVKNITFSNVFMHCDTGGFAGVIAGVSRGATIENVTIENSHFLTEGPNIAGLIGENSNETGIITDCKVIGSVFKGTAGGCSGIAAKNTDYSTIKDCYVDITIDGKVTPAGIVGENNSIVDSCIADGIIKCSISGDGGSTGGIASSSKQRDGKPCVIKNNISRMSIAFPSFGPVAGIVGETEANAVIENNLFISDKVENTLEPSFSASAIVGTLKNNSTLENNVAICATANTGILDKNEGYTEEGVDSIYISNCYYLGNAPVLCKDTNKGTIENIDYLDSSYNTVTSNEYVVDILNAWVNEKGEGYKSWAVEDGVLTFGDVAVEPIPTASVTETPKPTDTPEPTATPSPTAVPTATPVPSPVPTIPTDATTWDGTYDISWWNRDQDKFIITTAEQLAAIGYIGREIDRDIHGIAPDHLDGKTFILGNDIVMNDFVWDESLEFESELKPWVSARRNNFVLDGNGHTVYGLYIAPKATAGYDFNNYGIIDEIYAGGAVKNITFSNVFMHCDTGGFAGVIAGVSRGATIENVTIENSHFLTEGPNIAGLIGENSNETGIITDCKVIDSVFKGTGGGCSGIAAKNTDYSIIKDCYVDITIDGSVTAAGIVGENNSVVDGCVANGEIKCTSGNGGGSVGGIAAASKQRDDKPCVIKNCTAKMSISFPTYAYIGGIVGETEASAVIENNLFISDKVENTLESNLSASAMVGAIKHSSVMENNVSICPTANAGIFERNEGYTEEGVESLYVSNCYYLGGTPVLYKDDSKGIIENVDYLDSSYNTITGNEYVVDILNAWVSEKGEGYKYWKLSGDTLELVETLDTPVTYVAEVGGEKYTSLADAVEKAANGATVTLLDYASGAGVKINKDITIDFGGFTYTLTEGVGSIGTESNGFQILKDNTVVLKNGKLEVAEESKDKFYTIIQNYADLTVEDMTLDGTNLDKWSLTDGDSYVLSVNSGDVFVTGATNIIANDEGDLAFAFDSCEKASYEAPVVTVTTTGIIDGKIESTGGAIAISGGTYTVALDPSWCAEGYVPADNDDGTYSVKLGYSITLTDTNVVTTGVEENAVIILASYNGTRLVDVQYFPISEDIDVAIADTELDTSDATSVSAMLVKDTSNIRPLCTNATK